MNKRCCCGIFLIKTAAQILATLMIISVITIIVAHSLHGVENTCKPTLLVTIWGLIVVISKLIRIRCLPEEFDCFHSAYGRLRGSVIIAAASLIFCIYGLFDQYSLVPNQFRIEFSKNDEAKEYDIYLCTVALNLVSAIFLVFSIWFHFIFKKCYLEIREFE
ncbi:hypothetical protein PRIPAC_96979, partial [Pristionchus pacificus]|uniref:Uncharacterized protein n=1 Tax=Pristionchus pacificus TaxID=54126 RepID=A0A2A6BJB7_PRIPA